MPESCPDLPAPLRAAQLESLLDREAGRFSQRTQRSAALHARGRASMLWGVPMAWMQGLYAHAPLFVETGQGAWFHDVDGNAYLDMNLTDLATSLGFAPPAIRRAARDCLERGTSFLLPGEDAIAVCEALAERSGLPKWQFTNDASEANAELIRISRALTGKPRVLMFDGKYHGMTDATLVSSGHGGEEADYAGLPAAVTAGSRTVPFNDLDALRAALAAADVACLLAEPAMSNCNLVLPDPGFWAAAGELVRAAGALLIVDEAHCHNFAFGGLTRAWDLRPDMMVIGKGMGSGHAFACYGLTAEIATRVESYLDDGLTGVSLPLGGTTYANALVMAVARAALRDCLTEAGYDRVAGLGRHLADGLEGIFQRHALPWRAPVLGGRSGWVLYPDLPRDAHEAWHSLPRAFTAAKRLFMANRGVWEAIESAGPACSFAHGEGDVDRYLEVSEDFVGTLLAGG